MRPGDVDVPRLMKPRRQWAEAERCVSRLLSLRWRSFGPCCTVWLGWWRQSQTNDHVIGICWVVQGNLRRFRYTRGSIIRESQVRSIQGFAYLPKLNVFISCFLEIHQTSMRWYRFVLYLIINLDKVTPKWTICEDGVQCVLVDLTRHVRADNDTNVVHLP